MNLPLYMNIPIPVKLENPKAMPIRAHPKDAGADLVSMTTEQIYPGEQKLIDTGVAIKIPVGQVGLVFNRSSQGKIRIQIANGTGVIDSDYRGNIKVMLINNGEDPYNIKALDTRIAQLVIIPITLATFYEFSSSIDWDDTVRGNGGFGSTGL